MKRFILPLIAAFAILCNGIAHADLTGQSYIITSGSATACTAIAPRANSVYGIWNGATAAQTVTLTIYADYGTCANADFVYAVVLGAGQVVNFPPVQGNLGPAKSLSYKLSAAATNYIIIFWG